MPTRPPATKRPARKSATPRAAAKKASPAKRGARQSAALSAADAASLRALAKRLGRAELAGVAGRLIKGWREDLDAVMQASRKSYAGLQSLVARQTEQIKDAAAELQSVGKMMTVIGPQESLRNLDNLARAGLELALADMRELAALAATSQREAFEVVQNRITKNIDEVQQLLRK